MKKKIFALLLAVTMMVTLASGVFANSVKIDTDIPMIDVTELTSDIKKDQKFIQHVELMVIIDKSHIFSIEAKVK